MQFDTVNIKRKTPIKRNNLFFGKDAFDFQVKLGKDYIEQVMNQTVILYQVDLGNTSVDDFYKEAKKGEIKFKTPIEINVVYTLDESELKTYDKAQIKGYYVKTGKLTFGVYEETLREMDCDIKRGDYIGLQITPEHMEFFTVADDGRLNYSNKESMYGYQKYYRTIVCSPVDQNEFNG